MNPTDQSSTLPDTSESPRGLVLWHRVKGGRWREVATGSSLELTGLLKTLPSGESITLAHGEHPSDSGRKG